MSRSRHRVSRMLLVMLAASVAVFAVIFIRNQQQNRAQAAATTLLPGGATPVGIQSTSAGVRPDADYDGALVTQAPTSKAGTGVSASGSTGSFATTAAPTRASSNGSTARPAVTLAPVVLSSKPLIDAKAKADAGKLLEARDIYNAALATGKLPSDQARGAKQELAKLNETIVFSPRQFENDPWSGTFTVPRGGVLAMIAKRFSITPELLQRVNNIKDPRRIQAGQSIKILRGPLHAVVDKSDFTLDLYFGAPGGPGSSYLTTYRVGLGANDSTPTGKWLVEPGKKLANPVYHSPRGEGVIEANDPKNPLGDYWIALEGIEGAAVGKLSYGIHGTIEPDSIGTMASMGCIRLRNEDVARVYEMLVEGKSTVVVVE